MCAINDPRHPDYDPSKNPYPHENSNNTAASNRSRNQHRRSLKGPDLGLKSRMKRTTLQSLSKNTTARNKSHNQATTSRHQTKPMSPPRKRGMTTFKT